MLVLTLKDDGSAFRLTTKDGTVHMRLTEVRVSDSGRISARIAMDLPDSVEVNRVILKTGEVIGGRGKTGQSHAASPLSSGVAEATLACTGQSSDQERSKEAPDAAGPLCRFGQGSHERAIHPHDIDGMPVLGSIVDAVA